MTETVTDDDTLDAAKLSTLDLASKIAGEDLREAYIVEMFKKAGYKHNYTFHDSGTGYTGFVFYRPATYAQKQLVVLLDHDSHTLGLGRGPKDPVFLVPLVEWEKAVEWARDDGVPKTPKKDERF